MIGGVKINKAILVQTDDWEGLFVNGELVQEGHTLNEGTSRTKYFSKLASKYNFQLSSLIESYVNDEYDEVLCNRGCFDKNIENVGYIIDED